jgi:release factor glutamine methyltransferase
MKNTNDFINLLNELNNTKGYEKVFKMLKEMNSKFSKKDFYRFDFQGLKNFKINKGVFSPAFAKDSILSPKYLVDNNFTKNKKILEIGCGSGIASVYIAKFGNPKKVLGVDINKFAVLNAIENRDYFLKNKNLLKIKESNLFENVKGKFDIIYWSFPWVYANKKLISKISKIKDKLNEYEKGLLESVITEPNYEIIKKLIVNSRNYLTKKGIIVLLSSDFCNNKKIEEYAKENNFEVRYDSIYDGTYVNEVDMKGKLYNIILKQNNMKDV